MANAIYQPAIGSDHTVDISNVTQGLIISHSEYDEKYKSGINATLTLVGINLPSFTLTFLKFELEDNNCEDYLDVSYGSMSQRFCGDSCKNIDQCTNSFFNSKELKFQFVSSSSKQKEGFLLHYTGKSLA